ncbi:MAG TPA: FHA domain-containing protein [Bacillota bacterium]|jgi:pSer/pThr/pTyr-binding forkhead associated (FHA) protein|nr:FHA domain-containing protein [Peptococcaceae bacterium MAG4]NLW37468.1 FHA domain-containing protein [Peptococcaceae bacterium]HPZ43765.1 FHA domain-containing protein [Bacillota bacterium]HQD76186.1 FHA domain-containing protein [Bacillota bacterium]HUM58888.1 FHA domain-containing protein [Bacillota bacterium]
MAGIVLAVLRYSFLFLLLLFLFSLVKWMIGDLKKLPADRQEIEPPAKSPEDKDPDSRGAGVSLTVLESSIAELQPGDTFAVNKEIFIGRSEENDIPTVDSFASTRHARIYLKEGQYWLEDLNSTNGTFLNGVQISKPTVLANADMIRVGGITFQFVRWGYEMGSDI